MLKAEYTLSTTPSGDEIKGQYEQEFKTISELEDFKGNRHYFREETTHKIREEV